MKFYDVNIIGDNAADHAANACKAAKKFKKLTGTYPDTVTIWDVGNAVSFDCTTLDGTEVLYSIVNGRMKQGSTNVM